MPYQFPVDILSVNVPPCQASEFKRSLEKLGFGGLSSAEKSLLVRRFDPVEEGMVSVVAHPPCINSMHLCATYNPRTAQGSLIRYYRC